MISHRAEAQTMDPLTQKKSEKGGDENISRVALVLKYKQHNRYRMYLSYRIRYDIILYSIVQNAQDNGIPNIAFVRRGRQREYNLQSC